MYMNTKTEYISMLFYDLPTISKENIRDSRNFRKMIIKNGYYQIQESSIAKDLKKKSKLKDHLS